MAEISCCGEQVFPTVKKENIKFLIFFYDEADKTCTRLLGMFKEKNIPVKLEESSGKFWSTGKGVSIGIDGTSHDLYIIRPPILMVWYLEDEQKYHQIIFLKEVEFIKKIIKLYH